MCAKHGVWYKTAQRANSEHNLHTKSAQNDASPGYRSKYTRERSESDV